MTDRKNHAKAARCEGKQAYASAKLAAEVAKRMRQGKSRKNILSYRCNFCGSWHIGQEHRR